MLNLAVEEYIDSAYHEAWCTWLICFIVHTLLVVLLTVAMVSKQTTLFISHHLWICLFYWCVDFNISDLLYPEKEVIVNLKLKSSNWFILFVLEKKKISEITKHCASFSNFSLLKLVLSQIVHALYYFCFSCQILMYIDMFYL